MIGNYRVIHNGSQALYVKDEGQEIKDVVETSKKVNYLDYSDSETDFNFSGGVEDLVYEVGVVG